MCLVGAGPHTAGNFPTPGQGFRQNTGHPGCHGFHAHKRAGSRSPAGRLQRRAGNAAYIRLGRGDATDEEVMATARAAQCEEFIQRLPQGYQTNIGENGSALSGGERQRISIARALLKNAPIVLLDEATASMDAESETLIQDALSVLLKDKTVMVIAHRMRTVANADKIVVLDDGKVSEMGTPAELMKKGGLYAHLVELQQGK